MRNLEEDYEKLKSVRNKRELGDNYLKEINCLTREDYNDIEENHYGIVMVKANIAQEWLERALKAEKTYIWHYLKSNPNDLPVEGENCWTNPLLMVKTNCFDSGISFLVGVYDFNKKSFIEWNDTYDKIFPAAWMEIPEYVRKNNYDSKKE